MDFHHQWWLLKNEENSHDPTLSSDFDVFLMSNPPETETTYCVFEWLPPSFCGTKLRKSFSCLFLLHLPDFPCRHVEGEGAPRAIIKDSGYSRCYGPCCGLKGLRYPSISHVCDMRCMLGVHVSFCSPHFGACQNVALWLKSTFWSSDAGGGPGIKLTVALPSFVTWCSSKPFMMNSSLHSNKCLCKQWSGHGCNIHLSLLSLSPSLSLVFTGEEE